MIKVMNLPKQIHEILNVFHRNNYEAYAVGGCVRDFLLKKEPNDWDLTTNADPEQIQEIFKDSFLNNDFGTVGIKTDIGIIEVTPYRIESGYSDKRHPDTIKWAKTLEEDLSRRDFTVNAMAIDNSGNIVDLYDGKKDLTEKTIKCVGDADKRFSEDALRLMRAVRFACQLQFDIEEKTKEALIKNADLIKHVSYERVRDEFNKIIMSKIAGQGIEMLREYGLLQYIIPELLDGYKVEQNKHHIYGVYEHHIKSLDYAVKENFNIYVRISALLHDIGKPETKRGTGENATFYNHEVVGARIAKNILQRLKYSNNDIKKMVKLIRYHLFYYNVDEVTEASVRRLVKNVGIENINELIQLRMCDRIGSGCPKALPYKLRHLQYLIDKNSCDAISVKMLKIKGENIMDILKIKGTPVIGDILDILLSDVLNDPGHNNIEYLSGMVEKLGKIDYKELSKQAIQSQKELKEVIIKDDNMTKDKYWVQ